MKLSEAIRLGAMLKPQGFGGFIDASGGSCAYRAATDANGGVTSPEWLPMVRAASVRCPACPLVRTTSAICSAGGSILVHLNDQHRWTREQIADWVETIEGQQAAAVAPGEALVLVAKKGS